MASFFDKTAFKKSFFWQIPKIISATEIARAGFKGRHVKYTTDPASNRGYFTFSNSAYRNVPCLTTVDPFVKCPAKLLSCRMAAPKLAANRP